MFSLARIGKFDIENDYSKIKMNDNKNEEGITLKHLKSELDAEILVERLQAQDIFAFIKKDDPAAMGLFRGASVIVRENDKERALQVLRDLKF